MLLAGVASWQAPVPRVQNALVPRVQNAPVRAAAPHAKIMGAALAAAFTTKDDASQEELSLPEKEDRVVEAIRAGLDAGAARPGRAFSALGEFGQASGDLAQSWLTPQWWPSKAVE